MLLNHDKAFTDFKIAPNYDLPHEEPITAKPALAPRIEIDAFTAGTMVETRAGWRVVDSLKPGDRVATYDGGFAEITSVRQRPAPATCRLWHVPAGSLNNCSDLRLTAGQRVAVIEPETEQLFDEHCVLTPIAAMAGFRGIAPVTCYDPAAMTQLEFDGEELVYSQTGTLIHISAKPDDSFFRTLGYGETRALLSLINGAHCAPDPHGFAPDLAA